MENHNYSLDNGNGNFCIISYELLSLLQWLMQNDAIKLKKIIAKALKDGLLHELQRSDYKQANRTTVDAAQQNILEFFGLLEALMLESINEQAVESVLEKNLMPAIDHIDSSICDDATVRTSIEKATAQLEHNPHENPQDRLFKELLKRWKPNKKSTIN